MDFIESLKIELGCTLRSTIVREGIYLIEPDQGALVILFYSLGTTREPSLSIENKLLFPIHNKVLIHIDEDIWKTKPVALLNRIATLFGKAQRSYARQTVAARIDKKVAMEFQAEHHLQGALSGKYRYGLFKDGELLAVAVFSGLRNMRHTENYCSIELLHFCHKNRHLVIGGISKLINAMVHDFSPNDVMTYIDKDWSDGEKFKILGFEIKGETQPHHFKVDKSDFKRMPLRANEESLANTNHFVLTNSGSIKMVKYL